MLELKNTNCRSELQTPTRYGAGSLIESLATTARLRETRLHSGARASRARILIEVISPAVGSRPSRVAIISAVTPDGRMVASGEADKADGTRAPFIALTDLSGKVTSVIQTKDFYPTNVCVAPDKTVWSFGATSWDEVNHRPLPGDLLRHFDFGKGQLAGYIPRSTFPDPSSRDTKTLMRCSSGDVAIFSGPENAYMLVTGPRCSGKSNKPGHSDKALGHRRRVFGSEPWPGSRRDCGDSLGEVKREITDTPQRLIANSFLASKLALPCSVRNSR